MEDVQLRGITDNIPAINNVQVDSGRAITDEEVRRHRPVVFIGNDMRANFFEGKDPLGKTIAIEGNPYEVVGVAKALGSVFGNSQDNFVMIPIESYFKTYGSRSGIRMVAKAIDQQHLMEAEDEARVLMRSYRHLRPRQDDNFSIFASDTIVSLWQRLTATIAAMAVGIVSVFMVVGGIVIMNIMLAVVTERTARNRHPQIAGRAPARHSEPIPGGIGGTGGGRRTDRRGYSVVPGGAVRTLSSVPMALP